ncbi:ABC-type transport system involved in multi-copper enzyme maturation permease subunit [Allocatelliglobosispora scoriae]|uniref:ABC-type transport system involved in multi-copper enzyme maturation permease subunit n=1 Tax=Allocatelliglobosispora scoriae TaxID=643052 RepID=A0A841BR02_9ACTN|nr:ABC transporter permease subunit [Allocatelliglobosispora scoriae]MBB5869786.1 ABC-type transport system involved in multi-copper enzyme maturation permease subunit [Allocatelliglobosispora scoriae]
MNLIKAELSRLASRRFVQILTALLFVVFAITTAVTVASTHQPTAYEWQQAQEGARQQREYLTTWQSQCLAAQKPETPNEIREQFPQDPNRCYVDVDKIKVEDFLYDALVFRRVIFVLIGFLAAYLALFGFLIGATFIGAEMSSGGLTNLLLWRPQRLRVLGAKLAVLLGAVGVFSVLFTLLYVGTFWTLGQTNGFPGVIEDGFWGRLSLMCLRGIALALIATAISFSIAVIGRHTAASLGVLTAYAVVWEGGARIVMEVLNTRSQDPWFLSSYVIAWMAEKYTYYRGFCADDGFGGGSSCDGVITWPTSLAVFGVILAVLAGGAFLHFRRRDIA